MSGNFDGKTSFFATAAGLPSGTGVVSNRTNFATGTAIPNMTVVSTWPTSLPASGSSNSDQGVNLGLGSYDFSMLNVALGAREIGLILASISFGIMATKAVTYFHCKNGDRSIVKSVVAGMVLLNVVQMISTIYAAYTATVIDFGSLEDLVNSHWSVMLQMAFMIIVASMAQSVFTYRLHLVHRNAFITSFLVFFTVLQLALAITSVVLVYLNKSVSVLLVDGGSVWAIITTFSVSAGLDIVMAALAYVWMQKPYVLRKRGKPTFMDELQYWTIKSLFACGIISLFNAIAVAMMSPNMTWLAGTFVLGNLYTLSVLLTLMSRLPAMAPVTAVVVNRALPPLSDAPSGRSPSTATLVRSDNSLYEDMMKAQMMQVSLTHAGPSIPEAKENKNAIESLGYHTNEAAV